MKKKYMFIVFAVMIVFLAACGDDDDSESKGNSSQTGPDVEDKYDIGANMEKEMPSFSFTDQNDETFSRDDLEGKWWVADMVFTNCTTVCLPMTTNMSSLQDTLDEKGIEAELVSFSVDPENDTPDVLKDYAEEYDADESNWHFLTGYDFETIQDISVDVFMQPLEQPPEGDDQVTHGTRFFIVDPDGNLIKNYDGQQSENMDKIADDLKAAQEVAE